MTRKGLRKHEFYLSPDVMDIILEVSSQRDVQLDKGLSQIVLEWKGGIERKPLTTKSPELSEVQRTLKRHNDRLNKIERNDARLTLYSFEIEARRLKEQNQRLK